VSKCELNPLGIYIVKILRVELSNQRKQIELYIKELAHMLQGTNSGPLFALAIIKQPFPYIIKQNTGINEGLLVVQVLTGARSALNVFNSLRITATLLLETGVVVPMEGNVQPIDAANMARFPLRFPNATRKMVGCIKFGISFGAGSSTPPVESDLSEPLIVISNYIQWEGSMRTLVRKQAFSNLQTEVAWPVFTNVLQSYFLIATKQDPSNPQRPFSRVDLDYLHHTFFGGKPTISIQQFDEFWKWFGKILYLITHKHNRELWQAGIIYGFTEKSAFAEILTSNSQPVGTFIIRFSERHPGQFSVVWVGDSSGQGAIVNHYLVTQDDLGNKKLCDFIARTARFRFLIQVVTKNGEVSLESVRKETALQQWVRVPPAPVVGDYNQQL